MTGSQKKKKKKNLFWRLPVRSFSWNSRTTQAFLHWVWPLRMDFWAIFTYKRAITQYKLPYPKKMKHVLKTTCKKPFLKYQHNTRFPSLCLASDNEFLSYFYSKSGHNSVENYCIGEYLNLFWRLPVRSFSYNYHDNARLISFTVFGLWEWIFELFYLIKRP